MDFNVLICSSCRINIVSKVYTLDVHLNQSAFVACFTQCPRKAQLKLLTLPEIGLLYLKEITGYFGKLFFVLLRV